MPDPSRLTSATVNGVTTEFTYDSRNRVVRRTSGNGTLNLTYSGWNLIEERNATGALEQVYVHGSGADEILVKITPSGPAYYHHDGLGSTIALTGENGELLESYRYDAFGEASVYDYSGSALPASPRENRFLFTGREWLSQVGLYDYRNRVYSAQIGRFLQTDPIRFAAGDVNLYRYVSNNPINLWDPLGLASRQSRPLDFLGPIKIGPLRHDRFKYDDGTDSGYYDDGKIRKDNPKNDEKYKDDKTGLDDNLLRKAEQKVKDNGWKKTPYDAIPFNGQKDHQCQNYCDEVLKEYEKLKNEQDAKKCE